MTGVNRTERSVTGRYWVMSLIIYLVIALVVQRKLLQYQGTPMLKVALGLLAIYGIFFTIGTYLLRRYHWFHWIYFPIQVVLILILGLMRPYEDTWSLLFITLGIQVSEECSRRVAVTWWGLSSAALIVTLMYTFGWISGLGFSLFYIASGALVIAYDAQYIQREVARRESQELLMQLQQAHQKLKQYAAQAEELAVTQERHRLTRDLHDSVSQMIFSITLTAQAARQLLERDPKRVPEQLDRLQEMTSSALSQLRTLITQLRPPQSS